LGVAYIVLLIIFLILLGLFSVLRASRGW